MLDDGVKPEEEGWTDEELTERDERFRQIVETRPEYFQRACAAARGEVPRK